MKKIQYILLLAVMACLSFASCSSDSVVKTPLDTPTIAQGEIHVSSLAFSWQPVSGATQYAYELYAPDGNVVTGGTTSTTSLIATGLKSNTTYTLKVWAFAAVTGDKTTSPVATLTATTNPTYTLDTPAPEATSANGGVTITWPEVAHATSYVYSCVDADGEDEESGETSTNSITFTSLPIGEYTLCIKATSTDEAWLDSEAFYLTFKRTKAELWRHTGTYKSGATGTTYTADIVSYDDGSYTIEAPFGVEGYSISFSVDSETGILSPVGAYVDTYNYSYFYPDGDHYLAAYLNGTQYSNFTGDKNNGEVWFATYLYTMSGTQVGDFTYDDFTWSTDEASISDICGTYAAHVTGYDYFDFTSWASIDRTDEVTISDNGDGTVNIYNFYDWEENFTAKVDETARTLTIEPVANWGGYYTFASASDETAAVVGTINDDNTITFKDFGAWYSHFSYIYTGMECVMTKKTE